MIQKGLHYTDDFPLRKVGESQFKIVKQTGEIVTAPLHRFTGQRQMLLRHGLGNYINFYGMTHIKDGNLLSMSDGNQTRYYWTTSSGRRDTYLIDRPSETFEEAWQNLFEALVLDGRATSIGLYNRISCLFVWYFSQSSKRPESLRVEGLWRGIKKYVLFEWDLYGYGRQAVKVSIAGYKPVVVPFVDHPLVGLLRK